MAPSDQTRACTQCEADVSVQATYCPFCGSDLLGEALPSPAPENSAEIKESLASLYTPPYSARSRQGVGIPDKREEGVFIHKEPVKEEPLLSTSTYSEKEEETEEEGEEQGEKDEARGSFLPLLFLSIGGYLFALGTLILLFAQDGVLTLQWQARHWIFYWLIGLPFFVLGVRRLKLTS